jgi:hypothetical protein
LIIAQSTFRCSLAETIFSDRNPSTALGLAATGVEAFGSSAFVSDFDSGFAFKASGGVSLSRVLDAEKQHRPGRVPVRSSPGCTRKAFERRDRLTSTLTGTGFLKSRVIVTENDLYVELQAHVLATSRLMDGRYGEALDANEAAQMQD